MKTCKIAHYFISNIDIYFFKCSIAKHKRTKKPTSLSPGAHHEVHSTILYFFSSDKWNHPINNVVTDYYFIPGRSVQTFSRYKIINYEQWCNSPSSLSLSFPSLLTCSFTVYSSAELVNLCPLKKCNSKSAVWSHTCFYFSWGFY